MPAHWLGMNFNNTFKLLNVIELIRVLNLQKHHPCNAMMM